ncbi:MAG TPA: hypothetical protein VHF67_01710 [Gaiellaceae bacterium]|jgi:hypothetical protein|nr:hypothetical protein [Gaiellaceae bacterium]
MTKTRAWRPVPLGLTAAVALVAALVAIAFSGGSPAEAHSTAAHGAKATAAKGKITKKELALRNEMRRLWEDHVTWTRLAIISLTTESPDTDATVARLLANQTDIGNAIKPFYGTAAGNALTELLRGHILIAADLVLAAKAGDQATLADAQARWEANARDIARFLNSANPRHWKVDALESMLGEHLRLTTEEAVARLQGDWGADVAAYDRIHHHALQMADTLSQGIVKQFPRRFR